MSETNTATPMATKRIKIRLDADLIDWFKAKQAGARGYQTAINTVLRSVVEGKRRKAGWVWGLSKMLL